MATGRNFILVFSPWWTESTSAVSGTGLFLLLTRILNITVLRGEQ
jgi:hypothetical protein